MERKAVASGGYAVVALGHASFALAHAWPLVAVSRAVSWIARGGKNPSRDSLLAGSVERADLGKAIGLERGMDSVGAVIGPLLAAPVLLAVGYRWLFTISLLPGLGAAITVLFLVREAPRIGAVRSTVHGSMRALAVAPGPYRRLLAAIGLFGLGNFSSTLLILRAAVLLNRHGRSAAHAAAIAVLLYAGLNAANALAAYPAGAIADRVGRRPVIIAFGAACAVFAFGSSSIVILAVLFVIVGASTGMVETAQSAYAAQLVEGHLRGRAFGLLGLVEGLGDLVSRVTVGVPFTRVGPCRSVRLRCGRCRGRRCDSARARRVMLAFSGRCPRSMTTSACHAWSTSRSGWPGYLADVMGRAGLREPSASPAVSSRRATRPDPSLTAVGSYRACLSLAEVSK